MNYLETLNPQQLEAVKNTEGPSMVIAGAGSGKTRVLTFRIAYLIEKGIDPFNILALTFTNKAAKEMKLRIADIIGDSEAKNISMGTFHSVFARILRHHSDKLGYPSNFTIYDTQDSRSLIKAIIKELKLDDKTYKPNLVHGRISSAKNNLISAAAYEANTDITTEDKMSGKPRLFEIYKAYEKRCFMAGAMDFDDLLFKTNVLLRDHADVLHFYQHRFRYILVDEYQDTNYSQYLIVKKLAAVFNNICVVGDDAQSIYSFRGANIENILNFKNDYPNCVTFKLEQNYRSTQTIVNAANSIIAHNKEQIQKTVWTENDQGNRIKVIRTLTDNEEGKVVSNMIHEVKMNEQVANSEFAILYRTNAQSRSFEEALRKLNLPYKIYGGLSFYQRKEIKDLLAYFRLTANPNDEEALKRVINYPKRGIGKTSFEKVIVAANHYSTDETAVSLWDVIANPVKYPCGIPGGTQNKINAFVTAIKSYMVDLEKVDGYELAQTIAKSSGILKDLYDDKSPEGVARYENIQALLAGIKEFTESVDENETAYLSDFMVDVALLTDADDEKDEDKDKITLMTIHASKGLEFPYVFIVGLEENLFPSQMALNSRSELEEERRLFYVALTRAEKLATLSYATSRYRWGNLITSEPSRFIEEIDPGFLEVKNPSRGSGRSLNQVNLERKIGTAGKKVFSDKERKLKRVTASDNKAKSGTTASQLDLKVGYNVKHERFGKGKVIGLEGDPPVKATVFFPKVGNKQLLLKFARLEVLS
jgi:DNA helicase-2/ATP-dependent DNA helicase PcrA